MLKSLYSRFALYTFTVMLISSLLSFEIANIYYHFQLKEKNDAKIMATLKRAEAYKDVQTSQNLDRYLALLGDLNYQVVAYDKQGHATYYGEPFRKQNLTISDIQRVQSGKDYHGIGNRPFNPVITGFFDNETRNTVGTHFTTPNGNVAVFIRPDIGHAFGEFRIFLLVLLVLLVLFSIALVTWSTYALVKPVKQLKYATERLMAGDFATPIAVTRRDELGVLQQHFDTMRLELKQLDDMRQHFVQNVSHEIKTPLTHIHHLLTQLQQEHTTPQQARYIERIYDETHRLSQLVRQLLLLSELDNDTHLQFDDTFLANACILDILKHENYAIDQKNQVLLYDLEAVTIRGNSRLIAQAFENVIRNAIKYTEAFGTIEIDLTAENDQMILKVRDDGPGMNNAVKQRIFERFYKSSSHTDSNGLGLAISKSIIERHGGRIEVESKIDHGTTFTIFLPRIDASQPAQSSSVWQKASKKV
ncbi:sensor histidine kinase [Staphylococcus pseudintermedius]|uniref:sensor histidine kinase n=2 Tax=Staphylococcus pseudintermedius TaxID=283734 RepID=UPI0016556419|nr:HAMP domain-containing sensor histidine kinase [Staphylococcus pseudintermedius]EGQ1637356.1 HAMP domain-containing histidine kinase [Staphylococcus pseudintermedius]EGQ2687681.1 HAMP domain-containing histidine kinase [Staphylococcus pseudintermedius]EGQ4463888.1 sensor histidine kinase [Staphylococcus pseudintermedius]EHL7168628.1 HAMP domain-containing histidine kinase [Staphylococcus pseudintermedius]EJA1922225.1 HAMP domain-containing histidine kinase [Staphylococcus pseudintermedius]